MSESTEHQSTFRPTERRQFQFDELDAAITALSLVASDDPARQSLEYRVAHLKLTISLQGPDVGEFEV